MVKLTDGEFSLTRLAQRIQFIRVERRWSQTDLAEAAGLTQAQISALENMKYQNPTINVLFAIADAAGVSREYIMLFTNNPKANMEALENQSLQPADAALLDKVGRLNERERGIVEGVADLILRSEPLPDRRRVEPAEPEGR